MQDDAIELVNFDDGHSPGATAVETKLAIYKNKHSSNFFSVYDNVLPDVWCNRAYQYAVERKKPWGKDLFSMFYFVSARLFFYLCGFAPQVPM